MQTVISPTLGQMAAKRVYNSTLLLIQGIVLICFSVLVFLHPSRVLDGLEHFAGFFSLGYGLVSLFRFFFGEESGRIFPDLFLALMLCGMAILLFQGSSAAREWLLFALSSLFLLLAVNVFLSALELRYLFPYWWLGIILLLLSVMNTYLIFTGKSLLGVSAAVFTAVQLLLMGVLMVWIGILDRRTEAEYRKTLRELKTGSPAH